MKTQAPVAQRIGALKANFEANVAIFGPAHFSENICKRSDQVFLSVF